MATDREIVLGRVELLSQALDPNNEGQVTLSFRGSTGSCRSLAIEHPDDGDHLGCDSPVCITANAPVDDDHRLSGLYDILLRRRLGLTESVIDDLTGTDAPPVGKPTCWFYSADDTTPDEVPLAELRMERETAERDAAHYLRAKGVLLGARNVRSRVFSADQMPGGKWYVSGERYFMLQEHHLRSPDHFKYRIDHPTVEAWQEAVRGSTTARDLNHYRVQGVEFDEVRLVDLMATKLGMAWDHEKGEYRPEAEVRTDVKTKTVDFCPNCGHDLVEPDSPAHPVNCWYCPWHSGSPEKRFRPKNWMEVEK